MPRSPGDQPEAGPLHQCRSGDDEPLSARGGFRDRRRGGDGPRSRPLRALHRHTDGQKEQPHDRAGLFLGHLQGTAGGLFGKDRSGHSAHYGRDQGVHPENGGGLRRGDRGDRRDRGRHREPAVSRGHPSVPQRGRSGERHLHPFDLGSLHQDGGRGEDETDAAQRQGPSGDRHPAGHPSVPDGGFSLRGDQSEDFPFLQR